jgi:Type I restriction enzyme R protein N terminus (HSDR_N)
MSSIAVTEAVKSIHQAEKMFGLVRAADPRFFSEWMETTDLQVGEEAALDRIKTSYLYNSAEGSLSESTINLLVLSPLLYLTGFCDPPFKIRGEMAVEITAEESGTILSGRVDALVLQNQLWLILVESKQAKFSFSAAIPQALSYMMASPNPDQPTFGMVTNGDGFLFIKLVQQPRPLYALSDDFSMFAQSRNELYDVARILKRLGERMVK